MANPQQPTKPTKHDPEPQPSGGRGQNEGIGTESNPHGAVSPDPRKNLGQNAGLGTESTPAAATPGKPAKAADAPILAGFEGDSYATVTLIGGGPGDGSYRAATPLPQAVVSNGGRYLRSTPDTYAWQVP